MHGRYLAFTAPWHRLQLNLRGRRPWEKFRILATSLRHQDRNVRLAAMYTVGAPYRTRALP